MRSLRGFLAGIWLAAALVGCASYKPAPISPQANAAAIGERSLNDPRLRTFIKAVIASDPRTDAVDPEEGMPPWALTTLTLAALYYHPNLDIARSKLAEARAAVTTAAQVPNPSLTFEELGYNATVGTPSPWFVTVFIDFFIETFGKRGYRTAQARHLMDAARDDLATASWQVRGGVRNALVSLWAAEHRLALFRQRLDLQDQLVTLLEHRFAVGEVSALDLARERIARDQIGLSVRNAERQGIEARSALATAIGIPVSALDGVHISFGAVERPHEPGPDLAISPLRQQALTERSDVQALLASYAAAESALSLQIANQYPNVRLSPGYSYDQGQNRYLLAPAAELPIFNQNQGPIAEAIARRAEAAARFSALQTRIIEQVDGAAADVRAADRTLRTADGLMSGEQDRERRVMGAFRAGQVDRPTLLTAEVERAVAEQSRFDALVQQREALGALEDALRHPLFASTAALPVLKASPRRPSEPSS